MEWSLSEVESAVLEAMASAGIPPERGRLLLDGKKHRYTILGDKKKEENGEYCIYVDEYPAGYFKSYKASHGYLYQTWAMQKDRPLSEAERKRYLEAAQKREAEREQKETEREKGQSRAILRARARWDAGTPADAKHPYIRKKGLSGAYGARLLGTELLLPVVDERGGVMSVQRIAADGGKRFESGAPVGGYFIVVSRVPFQGMAEPFQGVKAGRAPGSDEPTEENGSRVWICEGWATGATIHESTDDPVLCALSAGNLLRVARLARRYYAGMEIVVAPDFDRSRGNAGMAAAFEIVDELGLPIVPPSFGPDESGSDWNDYCALHGMERTRKALFDKLGAIKADPGFALRRREKLFPDVNAKTGRPKETIANLESLLYFLNIRIRYNEIGKNVEFRIPGRTYVTDDEQNAAVAWIRSECAQYGMPKGEIDGFLTEIASRNAYNPVMEWIQSKPWDGLPRVDALIDTLETPADYPDDLKEILVRKWLISCVAAAASRSREFTSRGVLILQGAQSQGKTSWFRRLVPPHSGWFMDGASINPTDKDDLKLFISHWIVELGEFEGTLKRIDISRLKAFITKGTDEVRLPWAKKASLFPRRTILCATVNQEEVFNDPTGNSRWWLIPCVAVDYRHEIDSQQIWAECYTLYQNGVSWWLSPEEELRLAESNRNYERIDPVEDLLSSKLDWGLAKTFWEKRTVTEILIQCGLENPTTSQSTTAGLRLRKMGALSAGRAGKKGARQVLAPPKKY